MSDLSSFSAQPSEKPLVCYDPIHGWPVIYAPLRAKRPFDFSQRKQMICPENDPFAEGHEDITTPETLAIRTPGSPPDGPGWQVRIIPNKYPALSEVQGQAKDDFSVGVHEVVIECPQRETHFTRLDRKQRLSVLRAILLRLQQLAEQPALVHAMLFKNHGFAAGASLTHSHSQLMATRFVPPQIQREVDFCCQYFADQNRDYFDDLIARETASRVRIVEQTEHLIVLCPAASRFGLEMQILPLKSEPHFHRTSDEMLEEFNELLWRCLQRLAGVAGDPDYNLVLHSAPFHQSDWPGFRWHWEIYPRIAGIAGFELGAGGFVNVLLPEQAAELLRYCKFPEQ